MRFSDYVLLILLSFILSIRVSAEPNPDSTSSRASPKVASTDAIQNESDQTEIAQAQNDKPAEEQHGLKSQTLWIFEGPLAPRIQGFVREMYAERVAAHIFDRKGLFEHLQKAFMISNQTLDQETLGCLSDQATCDDQALLMRRLALKERIFVSAVEDEKGFLVRLERRGQSRESVKTFQARHQDLSEACAELFEQFLQVGTLSITGLPKAFELKVNDQKLEVERWPIVLEAGEHELTLSAPEHEALTLKILIKPSLLTEVDVKLTSSKVQLKIIVLDDERMNDLRLKIDEKVVQPEAITELRINQDYTITAQAEDRSTYTKIHRFKPNDDTYTLTIEMPYSRPYWKVALKTPHPERIHNSLAYVRVSGGQLNAGSWKSSASQTSANTPDSFKSQGYPVQTWGFDLGVKWDADPSSNTGSLRLDLAGFGYQHIGDPFNINEGTPGAKSCHGTTCIGVDITSLDRYLTRLLWIGYQVGMWKVTPYANLGLIWLYERGELTTGGEVSAHALRLGWEVGFDALLSSEWGLKTALIADTWPGQRSAYQLSLGVSYAFSVPYPF